MPQPDDAEPDSLRRFAHDLQELRLRSGNPTLAALSARIMVSKSVLSEALTGKRLPTRNTVGALADALGGDREEWLARRQALALRSNETEASRGPEAPASPAPPAPVEAAAPARTAKGPSLRVWILVAAVAIVCVVATSLAWTALHPATAASSPAPSGTPRTAHISAQEAENLLLPAESCARVNGAGWEQAYPIQLHDGVGESFGKDGLGAGVLATRLVGTMDLGADGESIVLALACTGTPRSQCCAGAGSIINKVVVLDLSRSKPSRIGDSIAAPTAAVSTGNGLLGIEDGADAVRIDDDEIVTHESPIYPESLAPTEADALAGWFHYSWNGESWVRRG